MAATNRYSIYPSQFVGGSTLSLTQIHDVQNNANAQKDVIIAAGSIDPAGIPLMFAAPTASFKSHDIAGVLSVVSITGGLFCSSGAIIQFQNRVEGGTFGGSGVHTKLTSTLGWLGITGFSASQDGEAEVSLGYWHLYDGTNAPITASGAASLSLSPAYNTKFSLGPVYINSVEVPAITSVSVNPGVNYQTNRESGDVFARSGSIYTRTPMFTFSTAWAKIAAQSNILFNSALPGTAAFYLRKMLSGGSRVSDATTEHIKLSCSAGVWNMDSIGGSGTGDAVASVNIQAIGTMAASAASAIP